MYLITNSEKNKISFSISYKLIIIFLVHSFSTSVSDLMNYGIQCSFSTIELALYSQLIHFHIVIHVNDT